MEGGMRGSEVHGNQLDNINKMLLDLMNETKSTRSDLTAQINELSNISTNSVKANSEAIAKLRQEVSTVKAPSHDLVTQLVNSKEVDDLMKQKVDSTVLCHATKIDDTITAIQNDSREKWEEVNKLVERIEHLESENKKMREQARGDFPGYNRNT